MEIATAYLLAHLRLYSTNSASSYIAAWLRYAKADSSIVFQLEAEAREIAEYILAFEQCKS